MLSHEQKIENTASAETCQRVFNTRNVVNFLNDFLDTTDSVSVTQINKSFAQKDLFNRKILNSLAARYKIHPETLIKALKKLNVPNGDGATPLITLCENGPDHIVLPNEWLTEDNSLLQIENFNIGFDYWVRLLHVLVIYCGYDINFTDKYGKTGLSWLMNFYNPNDSYRPSYQKTNYSLIKYFLQHPKINTSSISKALFEALGNRHIPILKTYNAVSIEDIFETKKVDFNLEYDSNTLLKTIIMIPYYQHGNCPKFDAAYKLLKKHNPNLDMSNLQKYIDYHKARPITYNYLKKYFAPELRLLAENKKDSAQQPKKSQSDKDAVKESKSDKNSDKCIIC